MLLALVSSFIPQLDGRQQYDDDEGEESHLALISYFSRKKKTLTPNLDYHGPTQQPQQ